MGDLTDIDRVKIYMGIAAGNTSKDDLINQLIPQLSAAIERYCDRSFYFAEYRDFIETVQGRILYLPNKPVQKLKRLVRSVDRVFKVNTARDGCTSASVTLIDGYVKLYQWGEHEEDNEIAIGANTLTGLKTAIEAIADCEWSCEITSGYEDHLAADLVESGAQAALYPNYAELRIPDYNSMYFTFNLNEDTGRVELTDSNFPDGRIFAEYAAGYGDGVDDDPDDLPADLVGLATSIVADAVREAWSDKIMKSEKLGDYAYTKFDQGWADLFIVGRYAAQLAFWRKISL